MNKTGGRNNLFIEHSLKNAVDFFKEAVFSDDIAKGAGLLQSIDPRLKMALLIVCVLTTCFMTRPDSLLQLYMLSILLAVSSGIKIIFFIKRVWFFIPLFTLCIAIPAVFINGWLMALIFVMRVTTCVSFVVVFTITTSHNRLLKSLRSVGVPSVFVEVLDMTYRYLFLFLRIFEEMHMGLKSRLVNKFSARQARGWIASRIAYLFRRSVRMSEEVYMAMIARGYGIENTGKSGRNVV